MLESIVKNCGSFAHNEVATKDFMDFFRDQAKVGSCTILYLNISFNLIQLMLSSEFELNLTVNLQLNN